MPYKSEKIRIAGTKHDLRLKLSDEKRQAVMALAKQGYSQRQLARIMGCSKGLIQHILDPKPRLKQKQYPTEYCTNAKRRYRERKEQLYKSGELTDKPAIKQKRNETIKNFDKGI